MNAALTRLDTGPCPDGTPGWLTAAGRRFATIERPGIGDHERIPLGIYRCEWREHPREGWCYELLDVPGRTAILIHPANVMEQLLGCIALGLDHTTFTRDSIRAGLPSRLMPGVTQSRAALDQFAALMQKMPFTLTIQ